MDDFEGFKTLVEEVIADVVETARETELELDPDNVIEFLQSHDEIITNKESLLRDEQKSGFLRRNLLLVKML